MCPPKERVRTVISIVSSPNRIEGVPSRGQEIHDAKAWTVGSSP